MTSCEGYFVDFDNYPTTADPVTDLANYGYVKSTGVVLADIDGNATSYTIAAVTNSLAGDKAVTYDVEGPGGEITKSAP